MEIRDFIESREGRHKILSKELILKIQNAEAEARRIRTDAVEEAKNQIRNAESAGRLLCRTVEAEAIKSNEEKLRLIRRKADELLERGRREAEGQAQRLMAAGEPYLRDAVKMIVGGVLEACR